MIWRDTPSGDSKAGDRRTTKMGDENQARQLQELGPKQVTDIKMVLDEARRKSP